MPPCKRISVHGGNDTDETERMLTIRVTDDEHARLLERCEGKQLAVWMRRDQRKSLRVNASASLIQM